MNDEKLMEISLKLRRTLCDELKKFWAENPKMDMEHIFFINSVTISSLIAQITFSLFKKDIGVLRQLAYIDEVCNFAKEQFKNGTSTIDSGISIQ